MRKKNNAFKGVKQFRFLQLSSWNILRSASAYTYGRASASGLFVSGGERKLTLCSTVFGCIGRGRAEKVRQPACIWSTGSLESSFLCSLFAPLQRACLPEKTLQLGLHFQLWLSLLASFLRVISPLSSCLRSSMNTRMHTTHTSLNKTSTSWNMCLSSATSNFFSVSSRNRSFLWGKGGNLGGFFWLRAENQLRGQSRKQFFIRIS